MITTVIRTAYPAFTHARLRSQIVRKSQRNWFRPLALMAGGVLLLAGCANFDDSAAKQTYGPAPQLSPQAGPKPQLPEIDGGKAGEAQGGSPRSSQTPIPPPQGCKDFDKAVIATCLDTVTAVAGLPSDGATAAALAGERKSGRILQVATEKDAVEFAKLAVDATGDGGLTGLALSPSYAEDQLVFAYITTPTDNRVVRIAKGQEPKPVLIGIPKGATGNHGAIVSDGKGALLVATGDAGNAAAAADPNSLAGKVLRIDSAGKAAQGNPTEGSSIFASGLHAPGGLCRSADGARSWVTDKAADKDVIYRLQPGKPLSVPAWTWPDKPGVTGCADFTNYIAVSTSTAGNIQNVPIAPDGSVSGKPGITNDGKNSPNYGRIAGMSMISPDLAVAGTVNKDGGAPISSDDRVVLIVRNQSAPGGNGKD
jgi:glucose/arabinose dehydrogenase